MGDNSRMSQRTTIQQPDGYPTVYVWETVGQVWACCATDHGPMCRLCQRVDDQVFADLLSACSDGLVLLDAGADGQFKCRLTDKGTARVEDYTGNDPAGAVLWARIQRADGKVKLSPVEEGVLRAMCDAGDSGSSPRKLAEVTGYTPGQVQQALSTLAEVGFVA